jgi:crotonobetainyl-CoA:carnitine CoA-transferase CaiB-like acyl-CoA transferase
MLLGNLGAMVKPIGFPVKMGRTPCQIQYPPPYLDQHTNNIFKELNISVEEINNIKQNGVI